MRLSDEEYLRLDPYRKRAWRSPTPAEAYRKALGERDRLQATVDHLCRQIDHPGDFARDPGDMIRRQEMARLRLPGAIAELRNAIQRTIELRPAAEASRPRVRREPSPTVWLDKPARSRDPELERWKEFFRRNPPGAYLTRDMRTNGR